MLAFGRGPHDMDRDDRIQKIAGPIKQCAVTNGCAKRAFDTPVTSSRAANSCGSGMGSGPGTAAS